MAMLLRRRQFAGLVRAVATTTKLASQVSQGSKPARWTDKHIPGGPFQLSLFMSNSAKSKNNASFEVSDLFGGKEEKVETISDNEDLPKTQDEPIETAEAKHEPEHDIEETVHDVAVEDLKTEESKTNNISVKKPKGYSKYVSSIVSVSTPEAGFYQLQTLLLASDISSGEKVLLAHSALVRILNLTSAQELVKDSSFETLADFVDINGVSLLSDALLSKLSEIVLQSDLDETLFGEMILNEAIFRLRVSNINYTVSIIDCLKSGQKTDIRQNLNKVATERLLELVENAGANDLIDTMFRIHSHPHLGPLLDDIALKNLSEFSTTSLYQLLYMQAKSPKKNKILVSALKQKIASQDMDLSLTQIKNMFYACASLKIHDKALLSSLSQNLEIKASYEKDNNLLSILIPILKSCSFLGWRHSAITNIVSKKIKSSLFDEELTFNQKHDLVFYIGKLNLASDFGVLASEFVMDLTELETSKPSKWLNMVTSLVSLDRADEEMISKVLQPKFYNSLFEELKDAPATKVQNVKTSLLYLLGVLHVQMGVSSFPVHDDFNTWRTQLQEKVSGMPLYGMSSAVGATLSLLAPMDTCVNKHVVSKYGHVVDFEIKVDSNGKAHKLSSSAGTTKVWIKVQDFREFLKGGDTLVPCRDMEISTQQLLAENPHTVFVPHTQWMRHISKRIDQLTYLDGLIQKCVKP
ncbi:uncharacterized protein LOC128234651 [Mya arenaria]|uniref:uncharacterized protein LOC128234651 n=1 Tax=Mya arenaria TaxID=6604 RepID=UPI0022E05383|nr:uncharacterized protein LOC128234651 [Mya arenaria]XP_052804979.1 uncharacterized protein LOC128234651 [Mya arenaria]